MTEAVSSAGGIASLGINGTLFIAQLINFGVVLFVVWKWVYTPLLKVIDSRSKKIADGLASAERAKQELQDIEAKKAEMLQTARLAAQQFIEAARGDAQKERQELMAQTQVDLERQVTEAKDRLKREKDMTMALLKQEVADLVIAATEKVAATGVSEQNQRQLIQRAIADLDKARV